MRVSSTVLAGVVSAMMLCSGAAAADAIKFKDLAVTKIMKAPGNFGSFETAAKYGSSMTAKIEVAGLKAASLTKASVVRLEFSDSSSGSDKVFDFKLGDDPKYTDGASSVKFEKRPTVPVGVNTKLAVELTVTLKITDGLASITYSSKFLPLYAQTFINFGSIPGGVKFPEGKSENSKSVTGLLTVGTFTKMLPALTYKAVSNNKKAKDSNLWSGSASGTISAP